MRTLPKILFGLGSPHAMVSSMIFLLTGMLIVIDAQVGIQTPSGDVKWIMVFADLDDWLGWACIWFGFDSIFRMNLTRFLLSLLTPVFTSIMEGIFGEERIKQWQGRLGRATNDDDNDQS